MQQCTGVEQCTDVQQCTGVEQCTGVQQCTGVEQCTGVQQCTGALIRHRTIDGICNGIANPSMGATGMPFARNVAFESTFPELGLDDLARNRHGDRIGVLRPDPQVISRRLLTRRQPVPDRCRDGNPDPADGEARCDYLKAPFSQRCGRVLDPVHDP